MGTTPGNLDDRSGANKPTRDEIVEKLREHLTVWDDPANETMTEDRFEELAALSPQKRAEQATHKELSAFEQVSKEYLRVSDGLASIYGKSALAGIGSSAFSRALAQTSVLNNIGAAMTKPVFRELGLIDNALGLDAISGSVLGQNVIAPDIASALKALTSPSIQLSNPITEMFAKSAITGSNWADTSSLHSPSVFQAAELQRIVTGIVAPTIAQVLSSNSPLINAVEHITRQWWANEDLVDTEAYSVAVPSHGPPPDEHSMEEAWQDIERVLRADKQLRKSISSGARKLSRQAKIGRKPAVRIILMIIIIWVCAVAVPWTDGERKLDDITVPVGLLATEYLAYFKLYPSSKKNPLQKNGPRRRRHRRKR